MRARGRLRTPCEEEKGGGDADEDEDDEGFVAIVGTSVQRPQRRLEETEGQREDGGDSSRREAMRGGEWPVVRVWEVPGMSHRSAPAFPVAGQPYSGQLRARRGEKAGLR